MAITCDQPCLLLVDCSQPDSLTLTLSDPTQELSAIHIDIRKSDRALFSGEVELPEGNKRGSSVQIQIAK